LFKHPFASAAEPAGPVTTEPLVAAVDQGTTGTRCIVFDAQGRPVVSEYREHRQHYPRPGWVEHDPIEIWNNTQDVIRGTMARLGGRPVLALGVTNQRETTVVWERATGKPIHNAIVWQDTRTRPLCAQLSAAGLDQHVRRKTGLRIATYFSGPKIRWILDRVTGARAAATRGRLLAGTIDSWLIWWLTGGPDGGAHVTDYTNASRTMLMDLRRLEWDPDLLAALRIPSVLLPQIRPSSDRRGYGGTRRDGPLGATVPVYADFGDQQAALFGQACFGVGEAKNTFGTGNFLLLNTGPRPRASRSGLLTTVAYGLEPSRCVYALEGSIAITGAAVQWLRDNLGIIRDAGETEALARSLPDAGGIYFVPAFSGLFAPYWDMSARGAVLGLTRAVGRAHLARATLEAIGYQTADVVAAMERDAGIRLRRLKVDGGAVGNDFLMQLQADMLGVEVVRPRVAETTALGAAYGAGLAAGVWSGLDDLRKNWALDRVFHPQWTARRRREALAGWRRAVQRTRHWV